jgi:hypothetical protein
LTNLEELKFWAELRQEQTGKNIEIDANLSEKEVLEQIEKLKKGEVYNKEEPNEREAVFSLCAYPIERKKVNNLESRILGALVGRFAGCLLGVPVENYSIANMQNIAKSCNMQFPPIEYWHIVDKPDWIQYGVNKRSEYTLSGIKFNVPLTETRHGVRDHHFSVIGQCRIGSRLKKGLRIKLGGTSGDNDLRAGIFPPHPPHHTAAFGGGLGSHGTAVEHYQISGENC